MHERSKNGSSNDKTKHQEPFQHRAETARPPSRPYQATNPMFPQEKYFNAYSQPMGAPGPVVNMAPRASDAYYPPTVTSSLYPQYMTSQQMMYNYNTSHPLTYHPQPVTTYVDCEPPMANGNGDNKYSSLLFNIITTSGISTEDVPEDQVPMSYSTVTQVPYTLPSSPTLPFAQASVEQTNKQTDKDSEHSLSEQAKPNDSIGNPNYSSLFESDNLAEITHSTLFPRIAHYPPSFDSCNLLSAIYRYYLYNCSLFAQTTPTIHPQLGDLPSFCFNNSVTHDHIFSSSFPMNSASSIDNGPTQSHSTSEVRPGNSSSPTNTRTSVISSLSPKLPYSKELVEKQTHPEYKEIDKTQNVEETVGGKSEKNTNNPEKSHISSNSAGGDQGFSFSRKDNKSGSSFKYSNKSSEAANDPRVSGNKWNKRTGN